VGRSGYKELNINDILSVDRVKGNKSIFSTDAIVNSFGFNNY